MSHALRIRGIALLLVPTQSGGTEIFMEENICRFVPIQNVYDNINTVNFVYETVIPEKNRFITKSVYMLYLVTEGNGRLCHTQKFFELRAGDLFFTFPGVPFSIQPENDSLRYIYISFLGIRAGKILEEMGINAWNCVFPNYQDLEPFWNHALSIATQNNLSILSESVLLYSLSLLSYQLRQEEKITKNSDTILKVKKYIDDNYTAPDLSLEKVCSVFQYNPKYLSGAFKKFLHIGFSDYLRTLRIQHACTLINEGLSTVKDIAYLSGYKDPLYFSKVFKAAMQQTPKEYIHSVKRSENRL